uniref:lysozyme n=1 Tax=Callorhinchus milii TaxID=7868 RepID=K4G963_CALMI|nr:lysozyme variant [Callorhinchus milii]
MKTLFVLSLLFLVASAKIYDRCVLARQLKAAGLDGFRGYSLPNWICMVQHESSYNTRAINENRRQGRVVSTDYGLFQINSRYWCDDGRTPGTSNTCRINCSAFLNDDITDDIRCVKGVVSDPNGMAAWYGWRDHCRGRNLQSYVQGCNV